MAKKKYGYRYWKKRAYRRFKNISYNYFSVKLEHTDTVYFPQDAGQPLFLSKVDEQLQAQRSLLSFGDIFRLYPQVNTLGGLFTYYKIKAVSLEAIPCASNINGSRNVVEDPIVILGCRANNNVVMTYSEVRILNNALICDPVNTKRKYDNLIGSTSAWTDVQSAINGSISVVSNTNFSGNTTPRWTVKITLYVLYKKSKA